MTKTLEDIKDCKNVSVKDCAEIMNVSQPFVRAMLINQRVPFGFATRIDDSKNWTYHISAKGLIAYMEGTAVKEYFEENKQMLRTILEGEVSGNNF